VNSLRILLVFLVSLGACHHKTAQLQVPAPPSAAQPDIRKGSGAKLSWADCIKLKGSIIEQTYPEVCVAPDGRKAVQPQ